MAPVPGTPLPEPDRAGRPPHPPGDSRRRRFPSGRRSERLGGFPQWSHLLPVEDGPDGAADGSRSRHPLSREKALPFQTLTEPSPPFSTAPCSPFIGDPAKVAWWQSRSRALCQSPTRPRGRLARSGPQEPVPCEGRTGSMPRPCCRPPPHGAPGRPFQSPFPVARGLLVPKKPPTSETGTPLANTPDRVSSGPGPWAWLRLCSHGLRPLFVADQRVLPVSVGGDSRLLCHCGQASRLQGRRAASTARRPADSSG